MLLVITPKDAYATKRLQEEAAGLGIAADFFDVKELVRRNFVVDITKYNVLYVRQIYPYFTEMEKLIKEFVKAGRKVVDSNLAQGIDVSKWLMYQKLREAGLPIPKTQRFYPPRHSERVQPSEEFTNKEILHLSDALKAQDDSLEFPIILKWQYGFGSHHVFLVSDSNRLQEVAAKYPPNELLVQEYIEADCEYKVITVGYKSLSVVTKYNIHPTQKVSNLETGESINIGSVPEVVRLAELAAYAMGRELAKVDILQNGSEYYILEVNRSPGLEPFEKATRYNVAREFIKYLIS